MRRLFSNLEKIQYAKVPINYPKAKPAPPTVRDYEILGIKPDDNNRDIVNAYRGLVYNLHPKKNRSVAAQEKYSLFTEAYDKIMLFRMSEQGVPQPYSEMYYPPKPHTVLIKEFIEDNSYWIPHVSENYLRHLVMFWALFGILYTLDDIYDPFKIQLNSK